MKFSKTCKLSEEVCKLEGQIKIIAIPVSILINATFLILGFDAISIIIGLTEATIGVLIIWYIDRVVILWLKDYFGEKSFHRRVSIQIFLTSVLSAIIIGIMFYSHQSIFDEHADLFPELLYLKGLLVNLMFFNLMVNGIYEILFMVERLSNERAEKEKYKKAIVETRLESLRNQINPHFLFNTFNALSELIEEDPKRASNSIIELSDVYRYVLGSRDKNWELLEKELDVTKSFIEIVKIRYEKNVDIKINVDSKYNNWFIPPLSTQMLIENAIKHNEISSHKKLFIQIFTENETLIIENNIQPRIQLGDSNGVGLNNIKERYKYLLKKTVEIKNDGKFFRVSLPLIKSVNS